MAHTASQRTEPSRPVTKPQPHARRVGGRHRAHPAGPPKQQAEPGRYRSLAPGAFRLVGHPTARDCAATYFPEANPLIPLHPIAETSNTPTSKPIARRRERATG
jgi:hypothetical protein